MHIKTIISIIAAAGFILVGLNHASAQTSTPAVLQSVPPEKPVVKDADGQELPSNPEEFMRDHKINLDQAVGKPEQSIDRKADQILQAAASKENSLQRAYNQLKDDYDKLRLSSLGWEKLGKHLTKVLEAKEQEIVAANQRFNQYIESHTATSISKGVADQRRTAKANPAVAQPGQ